jgi:hypothetical protein
MILKNKYIKAFSKEKSYQLLSAGYIFLYEQNGVYYYQNNNDITEKFSCSDLLKDTKFSTTVNF